jgi:CHRD domain
MNNALSRRAMVVISMAFSISAACGGIVQADPIAFKVPLSGGQEVPPVFPAGAGMAELTYDPATRAVTWTVTYSALSSPVTAIQFHSPAQPGKNAAVGLTLVKQGGAFESPINGQATLTPDQARQFAQGEWYINIVTQNHADGEVRGQVLTPLPPHAAEDTHSRRRRSRH